VIKVSATLITQRFDDLSFDERDISADFVILRPEPSPETVAVAIESDAWSSVHSSPADDR
jgi:hypothetical protein